VATNGRMASFADLFHKGGAAFAFNQALGQALNQVRAWDLFSRTLADPRRNIEHECGHPEAAPSALDYQALYDRDPIARRVVEFWPKETWQVAPQVYEVEEGDKLTAFEEARANLGRSLRGESWFRGGEGDPVDSALAEADAQAGIGHYAVILLGLEGDEDFALPAEPRPGRRLLYLRVLGEGLAAVSRVEEDWRSPRYGQPVEYDLTLAAPGAGGLGLAGEARKAHWTRVVHISEGDVYAAPRMRAVYNRLLDLKKLLGGSAEMYWKGAFPGLIVKTPSALTDVDIDAAATRDEMEQFQNGLQRILLLKHLEAQSVAPQVVDPTPQIERQLEAIAIALDAPKRKFIGSERGELSSAQDQRSHDRKIGQRQANVATPRVVLPFYDRLIWLGVLPEPKEGYYVWWPPLESRSDEEKAAVAKTLAEALEKYAAVSGELTFLDFLVRVLGWDEAEANAAVGAAAEERAKRAADEEKAAAKRAERAALAPGAARLPEAAGLDRGDVAGGGEVPQAAGRAAGGVA
jgi:hypothetical protein